jgi:phosphoglycerol transferase
MIKRQPSSAEHHGLKIIHLLLPVYEHRLGAFRQLEIDYRAHLSPNGAAPLGLIGSAAFLYLLGRALLRPVRDKQSLLDALALFTVAGVMLATVGGLGAFFNYVVSCWLRAYERMSIFLGFFAMLAAALLLERARQAWAASLWGQAAFLVLVLLLGIGGLRDQTPRIPIISTRNSAESYRSDRDFVREVEKHLHAGSMIFQIPTRPFPEALAEPAGIRFDSYDLLRPGIHSRTLRWTGGALRGQEGDLWRKWLEAHPLEQRLALLAQAEFGGICVDCFAFPDQGAELRADLSKHLGPPITRSNDGRLALFDLAPFAEAQRARHTPEEWARLHARALHPILIFWRDGFQEEQNEKDVGTMRWADQTSTFVLHNGLAMPRAIRLRFAVDIPWQEQDVRMRIAGPLFAEELSVGKEVKTIERVLTIPPGRHRFVINCDGVRQPLPAFPGHRIVFRIMRWSAEDLD